jgi:WD40 repeat protein
LLNSATDEHQLRLWDLESGRSRAGTLPRGAAQRFLCLAVSAAGHVATLNQDRLVRVWDLDRLVPERELKFDSPNYHLAFSPAGTLAVALPRSIEFCHPPDWRRDKNPLYAGEDPQYLAFAPSGRQLVSTCSSVRAWDLISRKGEDLTTTNFNFIRAILNSTGEYLLLSGGGGLRLLPIARRYPRWDITPEESL